MSQGGTVDRWREEEWSARQFREWYEVYSRDHMTDDEVHNMRDAYQAGYQQAVDDEYT